MIYEQNCYFLKIKYFDNLIEINIKNIPNKFIRSKLYDNILKILNCINVIYQLNITTKNF